MKSGLNRQLYIFWTPLLECLYCPMWYWTVDLIFRIFWKGIFSKWIPVTKSEAVPFRRNLRCFIWQRNGIQRSLLRLPRKLPESYIPLWTRILIFRRQICWLWSIGWRNIDIWRFWKWIIKRLIPIWQTQTPGGIIMILLCKKPFCRERHRSFPRQPLLIWKRLSMSGWWRRNMMWMG